jgi:hypothetical protein
MERGVKGFAWDVHDNTVMVSNASTVLETVGEVTKIRSNALGHGNFPFRGSAGAFGRIVEGPLPTLHPPIPRQQRFRSDDGNDVSQPILDRQTIAHQDAPIHFGQGHPFSQLTSEDPDLLSEEVVLLGEVLAEELLDRGD